MGYSEGLDRASPAAFEWDEQGLIDELWRETDAASVGLERDELAGVLLSIGLKHNYGLAPETAATPAQMGSFWRGLHLKDLALAHACAFGRDAAWRQFMARFRDALTHSAISITGSAAMGEELAASLYAELFGLTERGEQRRSPLAYYSGRGSLKGFLRATLAQRNVDQIRRTSREMPITHDQVATVSPSPTPPPMVLGRLAKALAAILGSLPSEERFLLSAWYLDRRTLLDISHILRMHEATVSRRLQRLTERLNKDLLRNLQASGMSKAAAKEALGTDPRDLDLNLRTLLQTSQDAAFLRQGRSESEQP